MLDDSTGVIALALASTLALVGSACGGGEDPPDARGPASASATAPTGGSAAPTAGSSAATAGTQGVAGEATGGVAGTDTAGTTPGTGGAPAAGATGMEAGASGADDGATGGAGGTDPASCNDASDTSGGTPMLACSELAGFCGDCIYEKCCELAEICTVDADCTCMATCIGTASVAGTDGCLGACGLSGSPPGFADLLACTASACSNPGGIGGECSVPAGFQPPAEIAPAEPTSSAGIGSGSLGDCAFGPADPTGSVLQLQSADGSLCVRIERRNDGPGSMANTSWTLVSMLVGPLGEVALIDDPAHLCWYSSHHNFNDWAHAWSGSRYYEVKVSFAGHGTIPTYQLHVFEQGPLTGASCAPKSDGACLIATLDLVPAA